MKRNAVVVVAVMMALQVAFGGPLLFFLFKAVPTFELMFAEMGGALPLPTILVLDLSRLLRTYWWLSLPLGCLGFALDAAVLVYTAWRCRPWVSVVLGLLAVGALNLGSLLVVAAMYQPIFSLAGAVR